MARYQKVTGERPRVSGRIVAAALLLCGAEALGGCLPPQEPASYVTGLRVLGIKAEPPEAAPGQTVMLDALVVDTQGRSIDIAISQCLLVPLQGQSVNLDCLTGGAGDALRPLGSGLPLSFTVPASTDPAALGRPDFSGGVYLPLVMQLRAGSDSLTAVYSLRVGTGAAANRSPSLAGVFKVDSQPPDAAAAGSGGESETPLDPAAPLIVHAGEQLTLRARFHSGSEELYQVPDTSGAGMPPRSDKEMLRVSFFSTAGSLSEGSSGVEHPDQLLKLDQHLPESGTLIDLWVVGRDERGGADYLRRTLKFQ